MCGIAGVIALHGQQLGDIQRRLNVLESIIAHRGPDGRGDWIHIDQTIGFVHRRLAIIDLSGEATQPMKSVSGSVITYNGEIYNFHELRNQGRAEGYKG